MIGSLTSITTCGSSDFSYIWSNLKIASPYQIWLAAAQAVHTPVIMAALSPFVCLRFYF